MSPLMIACSRLADGIALYSILSGRSRARRRSAGRSRCRSRSTCRRRVLVAEVRLVLLDADDDLAAASSCRTSGCRRARRSRVTLVPDVRTASLAPPAGRSRRALLAAAGDGQRQRPLRRPRRSSLVIAFVGLAGSLVRGRCQVVARRSVGEDLREEVLGPVGLRVGEELVGRRPPRRSRRRP